MVAPSKSATYNVPLPDFPKLRTVKSKFGHVQAIRVGSRLNSGSRNKSLAYIYLPGALLLERKGKQFSLGTGNGPHAGWMLFVWEYLSYTVSKWSTFDEAREWTVNHLHTFIALVQRVWFLNGGNVGSSYRT